jgi:hypothetical protein
MKKWTGIELFLVVAKAVNVWYDPFFKRDSELAFSPAAKANRSSLLFYYVLTVLIPS